ncbi:MULTISPECIES: hypothetical protein [unclassified Xanthomonas]|uniref:hypothetical protein n=1 Tax=Xanthomonas sp. LMG 9002 TaxID=1591158 RepID=UPI0013708F41|nr:hypothetical protein [Xanthomonas sp. LMG 9002]
MAGGLARAGDEHGDGRMAKRRSSVICNFHAWNSFVVDIPKLTERTGIAGT